MTEQSIWQESRTIEKARRDKMRELMEEYDRTVYYPAKKSVYERCEKIGHIWKFVGTNPVGYPMYSCNQCTKFEIRSDE